jgi:hypothetical protein
LPPLNSGDIFMLCLPTFNSKRVTIIAYLSKIHSTFLSQ